MSEDQPATEPFGADEELLIAATKKDLQGMKEALQNGANASYNKKIDGTWGAFEQASPLHKVLGWYDDQNLRIEGVRLLLSHGADVNSRYGSANWKGTGSSGTAFEMAMRTQDTEIITMFLEHGADPNTTESREAHTMRYDGSSSYPVLYLACRNCKADLVSCLLKNGADPNGWAVNRGQSEYGPVDDTKETALHVVCQMYCESYCAGKSTEQRKKDVDIILRSLLESGADVNVPGRHVKVVDVERPGVSEDDLEANNPRSESYVPRTRNVWINRTPLHIALKNRNEQLVKILMAYGADPSISYSEDKKEMTSKELASEEPLISLIEPFYWTPSNHFLLPSELKTRIVTLQKCASKLEWGLTDEMGLIFSFACWEHFYTKELVFGQRRRKEIENDAKRRYHF